MANQQALIETEYIKVVPNGNVTSPKGFTAGGLHCGLKRKRLDLGWLLSEVPAAAAGVYTMNLFQAAPLKITQESIKVEQKLQGILVNSGNANACTGEEGMENARTMRTWFAEEVNIPEHYAAVVSTGVIGEQLPMNKLNEGIKQVSKLSKKTTVTDFENAILTTDTCTKNVCVQFEIEGKIVTIGGAAKGSGMIHPNMATMLGFMTTDANIDANDLHLALKEVTNDTFNMITVDGDTSTNDMVLVLANGLADHTKLTKEHKEWSKFVEALKFVSESLAKKIARDGEGATKLVEVHVTGAKTKQTAQVMSKTIISSNLVKSAIFGQDANWGRIICAIGYSGEPIDPNEVTVCIGPIKVVENGLPVPFSEDDAFAYLGNEVIKVDVKLQGGSEDATAWGCDLTYDYVRINASYRT